jgi:hypothetical protein
MGKTPRDIVFGPNRVSVSMDSNQAGSTMASRYTVAKNAAIIGASVFPVGKLVQGGKMVTGSTAYKVYGAVKRPILTVGVHQKIRGATTAMSLSKAYSKMALTAGVLNFGRNIQLARQKEYKRLGINVFGPPLSLFLYDNYMDRNKTSEDEIASTAKEQSRVGGSLPSKPKTRGNLKPSSKKFLPGHKPYAYKPKSGERCAPGYRWNQRDKMCVEL